MLRLAAGADSVRAVVLMIPLVPDEGRAPASVPLAVRRVEVVGQSLWGTLARYDDPERDVPLDTIPQTGRWWATRMPDPPLTDR